MYLAPGDAWSSPSHYARVVSAMKPGAKDRLFYEGKRCTFRYFFGYELPKTLALVRRLTDGDPVTVEMEAACFND